MYCIIAHLVSVLQLCFNRGFLGKITAVSLRGQGAAVEAGIYCVPERCVLRGSLDKATMVFCRGKSAVSVLGKFPRINRNPVTVTVHGNAKRNLPQDMSYRKTELPYRGSLLPYREPTLKPSNRRTVNMTAGLSEWITPMNVTADLSEWVTS